MPLGAGLSRERHAGKTQRRVIAIGAISAITCPDTLCSQNKINYNYKLYRRAHKASKSIQFRRVYTAPQSPQPPPFSVFMANGLTYAWSKSSNPYIQ